MCSEHYLSAVVGESFPEQATGGPPASNCTVLPTSTAVVRQTTSLRAWPTYHYITSAIIPPFSSSSSFSKRRFYYYVCFVEENGGGGKLCHAHAHMPLRL